VNAQIKAGRFLLLSRRFEDAKTRANNALAIDPGNVQAQVLLGNALAGLRDLDRAVEELKEAVKLDPANTLGYVSLGAVERAAGRSGEAEAAFKRAVESDPTSVSAQLALANFYWAASRPAEALDALHLAFRLQPNHPLVNQMLAMFLVTTGRGAEAEPYFRKLAETTNDPQAKLSLVDYYVSTGRSKEAIPLLQQLSADKRSQSEAQIRFARIAFADRRNDEAHKRLNDLINREPGNASALILKGQILSSEGKLEDAISTLRTAVSVDTASAEAHFALGRVYLLRNDSQRAAESFNETARLNPRAVGAQLALSQIELAEGRVDSSIQLAEQALKSPGTGPEARLVLVRGLIARRDLARADAEIRSLMARFPKSSAVQTQAGIIAAMTGNRAGAERALNDALSLDRDNLEALNALVSLDIAQRNVGRAVSRVEAELARRPSEAPLLMLAGRTYATAGDMGNAERYFRKTIEVDSSYFQAYNALGRLYVRQKRLDEALAEFDALSKRQPRPVQAHTMVGTLLEAQNKRDDARRRYEQALAIDPDMPVAANNLAWMYAENGENLDVALELAQRATRRLPEHAAIQDTLGWIYYKKGLATLAVSAFQKSLEREPKNATFHFHLGLALAKAGDNQRARAALRQAIALEPNFHGAAEAREALRSLEGSTQASASRN
jgi:tetratricopeptide (TPR) repeat protein